MAKKLVLILLTVLSLSFCFMMIACNGGNQDEHQHNHVFSDEWLYDATSHWHKAVCHDVESEKEEHIFLDNTCVICGYNALTSSSGNTAQEVGLRCDDYNGNSNYKTLTGVASVVTDLKVYTKDRKPIIEIKAQALVNNKNIKKVTLGSNVMLVGQGAFSGCSSLEEVVIENCAAIIQANAFAKCENLKKITFGDSIISIGADAFSECSNLEEVIVADIDSWCSIRFENANANPVTFAQSISINDDKSGNVVISDGVKNIGAYAFNNCKNLTSVEIPNSIVSIGKDAFAGCEKLSKVNYRGNVGEWCEIFMYSRYSNPLNYSHKLSIKGEVINEVIIPDGVKSICDFAFVTCDNIKKVSFPSSLLFIGDGILVEGNPESIIYRGSEEDWVYVNRGNQNESWQDLVEFGA